MAQALKHLLQSILKTDGSWKTNLISQWPEIIGELHNKVTLEKIQDDVLVLSVANSCWLQELYLLSPLLLRTINEKLDQPRIKQLRFKQAELKKTRRQIQAQKKIVTPGPVTLSTAQRAALAKITDPQLSSALQRFLARCHLEKE